MLAKRRTSHQKENERSNKIIGVGYEVRGLIEMKVISRNQYPFYWSSGQLIVLWNADKPPPSFLFINFFSYSIIKTSSLLKISLPISSTWIHHSGISLTKNFMKSFEKHYLQLPELTFSWYKTIIILFKRFIY